MRANILINGRNLIIFLVSVHLQSGLIKNSYNGRLWGTLRGTHLLSSISLIIPMMQKIYDLTWAIILWRTNHHFLNNQIVTERGQLRVSSFDIYLSSVLIIWLIVQTNAIALKCWTTCITQKPFIWVSDSISLLIMMQLKSWMESENDSVTCSWHSSLFLDTIA
jgi:hypothetical protein